MVTARFWVASAARVAARPALWPVALRQARRIARPGWGRRPPFLPLPDRAYLRYRLETQYGPGGVPRPDDVVEYLRWCSETERYAAGDRGKPREGGAAGR